MSLSEVFYKYLFAKDLSQEDREKRYDMVRACIRDTVMQGPASSVEVEKNHANLQVDADAAKSGAKRAPTIQRDSYIMASFLEHKRTLDAVMEEVLGGARTKVARVFRNSRLLDSSAPGGGLRPRRKRMTAEGHVKGRSGLLKGLL